MCSFGYLMDETLRHDNATHICLFLVDRLGSAGFCKFGDFVGLARQGAELQIGPHRIQLFSPDALVRLRHQLMSEKVVIIYQRGKEGQDIGILDVD